MKLYLSTVAILISLSCSCSLGYAVVSKMYCMKFKNQLIFYKKIGRVMTYEAINQLFPSFV